jgi:hypothetical protein
MNWFDKGVHNHIQEVEEPDNIDREDMRSIAAVGMDQFLEMMKYITVEEVNVDHRGAYMAVSLQAH